MAPISSIITEADVLHVMLEGHATGNSAIAEVMERKVSTVTKDAPAQMLPQVFERGAESMFTDVNLHDGREDAGNNNGREALRGKAAKNHFAGKDHGSQRRVKRRADSRRSTGRNEYL